MAQPYFLAIDAGTTCLKAVVMDAGGQIAAAEEVEMAGCYVAPCRLDMEALLQALAGALARLRPRCPQPWDALAGVGVTGQGDGLFPLDKNGRPFMPAITWQDGNAAPEAEQLAGLTRTLGNQRCNLPFPGSRMAILRRLKDHAPEEYRNIGYALGCVSFLVYCLTGQSVTDLSNCGEGVDLAKGSYAADIYQAFGLADMLDKLPSLRPSWAVAGPVSPQAASLFGLPAGLPVGVGALDTTAAAFGAGEQWDASIIAGTTLAVSLCLGAPQPAPTEKGFVDLLPFDPPVMRLTLGTAAGACALDFVRQKFFPGMDYGGFFALAAQSSPGANGVLFLPFINGERAPFSCPQATGAFLGLRNSTGPADLARACVEGIAYSARHCLAAMRSTPPRQALLSGGASKNAVFCQIFADALGIPLGLASAYPGAAGAAALLKKGLGLPWRSSSKAEVAFLPSQADRPVYAAGFRDYLRSISALFPGAMGKSP